MDFWTLLIFVAALALLSQSWFWVIAFFIGGLASLFAMLASIVHFQILGAVGFFFLMAICWGALIAIGGYREDQKRWAAAKVRSSSRFPSYERLDTQ